MSRTLYIEEDKKVIEYRIVGHYNLKYWSALKSSKVMFLFRVGLRNQVSRQIITHEFDDDIIRKASW